MIKEKVPKAAKRAAYVQTHSQFLKGGGKPSPASITENWEAWEALLYAIYEQAVEDVKSPILCERSRIGERERIRADAYYFLKKDPYGLMNEEMKGGIKELYEKYKR